MNLGDKPLYPPSWYNAQGELDDEAKELIAFNDLLGNYNYEICDAFIEECISKGINYSKFMVHKCRPEDIPEDIP